MNTQRGGANLHSVHIQWQAQQRSLAQSQKLQRKKKTPECAVCVHWTQFVTWKELMNRPLCDAFFPAAPETGEVEPVTWFLPTSMSSENEEEVSHWSFSNDTLSMLAEQCEERFQGSCSYAAAGKDWISWRDQVSNSKTYSLIIKGILLPVLNVIHIQALL